MKKVNNLCMGCMHEKNTEEERCPVCGYLYGEKAAPAEMLQPWTIVNGKYILGRHLGDGGFGITYIGWDINLEKKVAIKEFRPFGFVARNARRSNELLPVSSEAAEFFRQQKEHFIEEARILSKLEEQPGIVNVLDYFTENNTAYIVMEFLDGESLSSKMKQNGGRLPASQVLELMRPVIRSMAAIHRQGMLHRDISPDNIMLTNRGRVKLIDFGAAYRRVGGDTQTLSVCKKGYSPPEQELEEGELGTYTDIYAFCATMYHAMTGVLPQDAALRRMEDELVPPSKLGVEISPLQEAALMNGLTLESEERIQNAEELYYFLYLYGQEEQTRDEASPDKVKILVQDKKTNNMVETLKAKGLRERRKRTVVFAAVAVTVVLLCGLLLRMDLYVRQGSSAPAQTMEREPLSKQELDRKKSGYEDLLKEKASEQNLITDINLDIAAKQLALRCAENKLESREDKNELCSRLAAEVREEYDCEDGGWMVVYTTPEGEPQTAFSQIGEAMWEETAQNASAIGCAVVQAEDGLLYWTYLTE